MKARDSHVRGLLTGSFSHQRTYRLYFRDYARANSTFEITFGPRYILPPNID